MSEQALIIRNDAAQTAEFLPAAIELRDSALAAAALIGKVTNPSENDSAVAAQTELHRIRTEVEKARKAVKQPILDFGRRIDATAAGFIAEVDEELLRLARMLGDYQALEQARLQAEEKKKSLDIEQIERDRATELAACTTHEQMDAVNEKYNEKAAQRAESPASHPVRAEGQRVAPDWEVTVNDVWLLAKAHPTCVKIEPRLSEIKALLNAGVTVAGVTAKRIVKSGVRLKPTQPAIPV